MAVASLTVRQFWSCWFFQRVSLAGALTINAGQNAVFFSPLSLFSPHANGTMLTVSLVYLLGSVYSRVRASHIPVSIKNPETYLGCVFILSQTHRFHSLFLVNE